MDYNYLYTVEAVYMGRLGTGYSCLLYPLSHISSTIDRARGSKYVCQLSVASYTRFPFKRPPLQLFLGSFGFHRFLNSNVLLLTQF